MLDGVASRKRTMQERLTDRCLHSRRAFALQPQRRRQCGGNILALCDIFIIAQRERAPVRGYSEMFRLRTWSAKTPLRAKRRYLSGSRVKTHYRKKIIKLKSNEAIARFSSPHAICTPRVDIFHTSASHAHISTVHKTVFPDG